MGGIGLEASYTDSPWDAYVVGSLADIVYLVSKEAQIRLVAEVLGTVDSISL